MAIVGPSGSGKSTVVQLIERFYDTNSGEVLIDGVNIKSHHLRTLRRQIGYVGQEPVLINNTVKQNLLLGKPDATNEEIVKALENSMVMEFLKNFKEGVDLHVGNSGGQLSGG